MTIDDTVAARAVEMRRSGIPLTIVAQRYGVSVATISRWDCKGIPPAISARKKTSADYLAELRTKDIIELRNLKWSYKCIGDKHGITHERVRQILNAAGQDWAVGWRSNAVTLMACPVCHQGFNPTGGARKTCSRTCQSVHSARTLTPRERECMEIIMRERSAGATWRQANIARGHKDDGVGGGICTQFRKYCAKAGIDPSPWFSKAT